MYFVGVFDSLDTVYAGKFVFPIIEILCIYRCNFILFLELSENQAK